MEKGIEHTKRTHQVKEIALPGTSGSNSFDHTALAYQRNNRSNKTVINIVTSFQEIKK